MFSLSSRRSRVPLKHHATRGVFILCGAAFAIWAALVPTLRSRLGLEEAELGFLILCLGAGSLVLMPFAGILVQRFGCRRVMTVAFPLALFFLFAIGMVPYVGMAAVCVALLGASLGTVDVVMNIQAVAVEKDAGRPMLSGFHAMYPLGGIAGAVWMNMGFSFGLSSSQITLLFVLLGAFLLYKVLPLCDERRPSSAALPEKKVSSFHHALSPYIVLMGLFCFAIFLAEGSILDWSAIYLLEEARADAAWGPLGYASLCAAMTLMRLVGNRLIMRWGPSVVVGGGGLLCAVAYWILWLSPGPVVTLVCFFCIGLGAANMIPIFISQAGAYNEEAAQASLSVVTTMGYFGLLVGPALVGVLAQAQSLPFAYGCVGVLMFALTLVDFALRRAARSLG